MGYYDKGYFKFQLNAYISSFEVISVFKERIEASQKKIFENELTNFWNLKEMKIFYFYNQKWREVKGKSVKRSPFGLWVNKGSISRLIKVNELGEVLVCPKKKN